MFTKGDRVVVAVSGGADSVCLLHVLHELRKVLQIDPIVCHFDHGLRPGEDEKETHFVQMLAKSFDLPFSTEKATGKLRIGDNSIEEKARDLRYVFLKDRMNHFSAQKIAVGHTLNDQAETVIMRLLRGSGTSGLSGIPPVRDGYIVRPLIELQRKEIMRYLSQAGMKHVTDSSNLSTAPLRNEIRLTIMPLLKKRQPGLVEIIGKTAAILKEEREWMETEARDWIDLQGLVESHGKIAIPLPEFNQLHEAKKNHIIREALRISGGALSRITTRHIEAVKRAAKGKNPHARIDLPGTQTFRRVYESLVFSSKEEGKTEDFSLQIDKPGIFHLKEPSCAISISEFRRTVSEPTIGSSQTAFFDADQITYPLVIRNARQGDRFIPLGMTGHKKLKNFFIDSKIPVAARKRIPILTTGNQIIWICGLRIDDRFKVNSNTKNVLKATIQTLNEVSSDDLSRTRACSTPY
jgi:tRNA(Ile)-lysidine synthase